MKNKRSQVKWLGELPTEHFCVVPNELARDRKLTPAATRVALYLWSCVDGFEIGERPIGVALEMSNTTVSRALDKLIERRWITRCQYLTDGGAPYWVYFADQAQRLSPARIEALHANSAAEMTAESAAVSAAPKKTVLSQRSSPREKKQDPWGAPPQSAPNPSEREEDLKVPDLPLGGGSTDVLTDDDTDSSPPLDSTTKAVRRGFATTPGTDTGEAVIVWTAELIRHELWWMDFIAGTKGNE